MRYFVARFSDKTGLGMRAASLDEADGIAAAAARSRSVRLDHVYEIGLIAAMDIKLTNGRGQVNLAHHRQAERSAA